MNLRNWTKDHTLGLLIGIFTTFVSVFVVMTYYRLFESYSYESIFNRFQYSNDWKSRIISLAAIGNLAWFHVMLKRTRWNFVMGVILATVINLLLVLYFKFLA